MADEHMFVFDENGALHEYDPTFDVTIHCKSEAESNRILGWLNQGKRMQWISVKDRLPEEYKSVLGVANGVDTRIVHYALGGFWMEDTTGEEYEVTYWMPLPEPPKEVIP